MKNRLKKFVSIFLILVLSLLPFSFILDTKAEGVDILVDDTKCNEKGCFVTNETTITLKEALGNFSAYKILDVYYNETTNEMNYDFTSTFKAFLSQSDKYKNLTVDDYYNLTSDDPKDMEIGSVITKSTLNKLASEFTTYIIREEKKGNEIEKIPFKIILNEPTRVNVVAGTYLVFSRSGVGLIGPDGNTVGETEEGVGVFSLIHGAMVGNATFTSAEDGSWILNECEIFAKSSLGTITSGFLPVTLSELKTTFSGTKITDSAEVEELMGSLTPLYPLASNYELVYLCGGVFPLIPSNAIKKDWDLVLEFSEGINYTRSDLNCLIVKDGKLTYIPASDIANVSIEGQKVLITPTESFIESGYADYLLFFCGVSLNDKALMGGLQGEVPVNTNVVKASYTMANDPYGSIEDIETFDFNSYILALGIELENVNEKGEVLPAGGEYEVYLDEELTELIDTIKVSPDGRLLSKAIVDGRGNLGFYIKQTEPLAGYGLSDSIYYVDFGNVPEEALQDIYLNGYYKTQIVHKKSKILPITGGIGTIIYTVIGLLIIIIGVVFFIYYKKKIVKDNKTDVDVELL